MIKNKILIVDPFSTGNLYAPAFSKNEYLCYGVVSSAEIPARFMNSFDGSQFVDHRLFTVEEIKKIINKDEVKAVICGAETGVYCTDHLADFYNVRGNNPQTSHWRRQKSAMQERLKSVNLRSIYSKKITQNDTNLGDFLSSTGYVVKPDSSCLTEDVLFFDDVNAVRQWVNNIDWSKKNAIGKQNEAYLLQERLVGDEYVVDMVANSDDIQISSLNRYKKGYHNGSHFVYEALEVLDIEDPIYNEILTYAVKCCKALGIEYGPAHMELMLTQNGPIMIEVGSRLHGGVAPILYEKCYDNGLLSNCVKLVTDNCLNDNSQLTKKARIVFLINEKKDRVIDDINFMTNSFLKLKHVDIVKFFILENEKIPLTTDLSNCPAIITIMANSIDDLDIAEKEIRSLFL